MARKLTIDSSIATDVKSAATDSFKDNISMIEIDKIKESVDNFYSINDIDTLADDIERQGLKHNLVVIEDSNSPGTYFIKSGHRRLNAIKKLVNENKYNSKYIPCLIDGKKSRNETVLDLIMLNATTRVMSDAELYKQYEKLKEVLDNLKSDGIKVHGRLRERVAEMLNVSPAQVGKIENIKRNAVDEIKEAVESGDMTIATADTIAKLSKDEQTDLIADINISEIKTKDVKEHKKLKDVSDNKSEHEEITTTDTNSSFDEIITDDEIFDISEVDTSEYNTEVSLSEKKLDDYRSQLLELCIEFSQILNDVNSIEELNNVTADIITNITKIKKELHNNG